MTDSGKIHNNELQSIQPAYDSVVLECAPVRQSLKAKLSRAISWADVRAIFRIAPPGESSWSMVEITRPHAVIGRKPGSDIAIGHPDLEGLHTYLHFDTTGCYAIDLRTMSGMRINGRAVTHGRLMPGDTLEVGGFLIRLDGLLVNGRSINRSNLVQSLLTACHTNNLVCLRLHAISSKRCQWPLTSAVSFVGCEQTCSVALPENPTVSRIHGVFVRTTQTAFFVDLASRGTLLNGKRIYNDCLQLGHGDTLSIGQFGLRVQLGNKPSESLYQTDLNEPENNLPHSAQYGSSTSHMNSEVILAALLAQIQKQHDSALERQNEMQVAMAQLLRQVQNEQVRVMEKHLERIHHLDSEIASLKSQIHHDKMPVKKLEDIPKQSVTSFTPSPLKQPEAQPEPARKPTRKAVEPSGDLSASPEFTTAWLIDRVNQLEQEQTSAWKEMLGRFLGR